MSVPDFENILKDVVNAKRLSASKMTQLTEIAMKNIENDTKLVSILYRTHKSLPNTSAKISSLYVFDALARAAKHHATKHNLSGDAFTSPGNAASFLSKVGGVVEGLFQDLVAIGTPESKEKTKKILDIWTKGNTFPLTILVPLADILNGNKKAPDAAVPIVPVVNSQSPPSVDPRMPQITYTPPVSLPVTPSIPAADQHATLLALLTQAATNTQNNVPTHSTVNTTVSAPPPLDAVQLAVIQQLAHTAASVPSVPQFLPPADLVNVQKYPSSSGVNGSSHSLPSFRDEPRKMVNTDQSHMGYRSSETEPRTDSHFEERDNLRGRYRPGFRNRGRGERSGRNWDPRDRDHYRTGRDQSPQSRAGRGGRSRSRSPGPSSRYSARKGSKYSSSPPRPTAVSPSARRDKELGKDEFGRDIRPGSPKSPVECRSPSPLPPFLSTISVQSRDSHLTSSNLDSATNSVSGPSALSGSTSPTKQSGIFLATDAKELGMENFNPTAFDFTSPAQWEALGKMWEVTNGYLPSTEELMQFMMSAATGQATPNFSVPAQDLHSYGPDSGRGFSRNGGGGSRGGFSGGRGNTYANNGGLHANGGSHRTDAVVLQEASNVEAGSGLPNGTNVWNQKNELEEYSASAGGRMQRVGDKWLFIRGTVMDVS